MLHAVSLLSGGLDSTTLAYYLRGIGYNKLTLISVAYGQRHNRELLCAKRIAEYLGGNVQHRIIDLSPLGQLLGQNALTNDAVDVPEGHYESETMKQTIVPNRNAILLSIAYGVALSYGAHAVAYGPHRNDSTTYPDCRPEFVRQLALAFYSGSTGLYDLTPTVLTPFIDQTKADIVRLGSELGVPFQVTHSCYKGVYPACGRCATCVERLEAFHIAGVTDPLEYEDRIYWRGVVSG